MGYQLFPPSVDENTVMNPRDKLESKEWQGVLMIVLSGKNPFHPDLHEGTGADAKKSALLGTMGVPPSYQTWV